MDKPLQQFKFQNWNVTVLEKDGEPWWVGKEVADILGYKRTADAIKAHVEEEDKGVGVLQTPGGKQKVIIINESGLYSLILGSKLPRAKEFKHWVTSEVLPSIRKTGSFTDKKGQAKVQAEARLKLMQDRAATAKGNLLYKLAVKTESTEARENLLNLACYEVTGLMPIPIMKKKYYSAQEVADNLGISSANKVGRIANAIGIKAEQPGENEYGHWAVNKSRYSEKQVPQWLYTEKGLKAIEGANKQLGTTD